ncbi:MAG TPA: helix-turn-helix transcriptional regulator [Thermoanaerobaculia bacterium]
MAELTSAGKLFGERLRELRKKRGITQVTLAEATGIPQNHVSSIERGTKVPNLLTLIRLAHALECKVSALVSIFDKEELSKFLPR